MKQKYTLSIADVELNVTVDEAPEKVEYIVGVIDRKMRDILLKSKYCPKTQAALLCALDLCADKVKAKEEIDALNDEIATLNEKLKESDDKYARTQRLTANLEREKARIEIENMKLRAALEEAKKTGNVPDIDISIASSDDDEKVSPAENTAEESEAKKPQGKSRVGSMFDLLTFGDI
ncbi:MAG: cell division protein ZapA [Eubacteriales bacterium]